MLAANPTTTEAIITTFGDLSQIDPSISLTKHYKGVTLSDEIRIVDFQPGCAIIQASQREIFPCLKGKVHLHGQQFPKSLSGRIHPIDYGLGTFQISDLVYADWKNRSSERVQSKDPIYVNLHHNGGTFNAFLKDISISGMGILVDKIDPTNQPDIGEKVMLDFQLSVGEPLVILAGKLACRQEIGPELVKFGLILYPNAHQEDTLQQFISRRKEEILEEIYQAYIRSWQPYRVENLYF